MKKNAESRKQEAMSKIKELSRSKQELLEKQMAEQKKLISKIEEKKGTMRPEERSAIMSLIKTLADSISKTKEDLQKLVQTSNRRSASDVSFVLSIVVIGSFTLLLVPNRYKFNPFESTI